MDYPFIVVFDLLRTMSTNSFCMPSLCANICGTRLHSSRKRTARALTVSPSMLCVRGGVCLVPGGAWYQGDVPGPGGYIVPGGCMVLGGVPGPEGCLVPGGGVVVVSQHALRHNPPPREQNDKQVQKYYLAPNFVCGR